MIREALPEEVTSQQRPDKVRKIATLISRKKAFQMKERKDSKALH